MRAADLPPPNTFLLSGKLQQANAPAQGAHDFRFQLYDRETGGQITTGTKTVTVAQPVTAGDWQVVLDVRQFGADAPDLEGLIRPPIGSRTLPDQAAHTANALTWRTLQENWLEISVRRQGVDAFVPLTPRQRLTAVPGAVVAQTANHALVAGTVSEGGVDTRALAPGAINNAALAELAITAPKIAPLTVVRSLNGLQDEVTLAAGTGVSLSAAGNTITINSTVTGGGTALPNGNFLGANNDNQFGGSASFGVIGGGQSTKISDDNAYSTLGGGLLNRILEQSSYSFLGGGYNHQVGPKAANASLGGGYSNTITNGNSATISGGYANVVGGTFGTIGGGASNFAGPGATVAGGTDNHAEGSQSVVGGGNGNSALADQSVIGGGVNNGAENSPDGTIGGGGGNRLLNSAHSTIGGGDANRVLDAFGSVVAGGLNNTVASQASAILGGQENRTEGAQGYATVLGGSLNLASGSHSLAAGTRAHATHNGAFIWNAFPGRSDSTPFVSERDGEFAARAYGGFRFVTAGTDVGRGDITLNAGNAALVGFGKGAFFNFTKSFNVTAGDGINFTTGGQGLFVDGQRVGTGGGGGGGNGPINVITGGGQTEPQARLEQTNPDDYVRMFMNTPRTFWTIGAGGPQGSFSFYVPGQSPANTTGDGGANRFIITPNGEVGVGSDRPFAQFHVRGHGGFDLPQARLTQENPQDSARLRLETGQQAWDIAAGPDGSLRFFGGGADRMVLGAAGLTVNGRAVAFADQLGTGGGTPTLPGQGNQFAGANAVAIGGEQNNAGGPRASVLGGGGSLASGENAVVVGGFLNQATVIGSAAVGGFLNLAQGEYSLALGGSANTAAANWSLAAGQGALANHEHSFVWSGDGQGLVSEHVGEFAVKAPGGARLVSDAGVNVRGAGGFGGPQLRVTQSNPQDFARVRLETGQQAWDMAAGPDGSLRFFSGGADRVVVSANGTLSATALNQTSDRNAKQNFQPVDAKSVLAKVAALPISEWQFKNDADGSRHVGPMAQDFRAAFGLGTDERHIATVDADGVALAAIQGLNEVVEEQRASLARKDAELRELRDSMAELRTLLTRLAAQMPGGAR